MARNQIDPKENVDLINEKLHMTFYYFILLNDTTFPVWRIFESKVNT